MLSSVYPCSLRILSFIVAIREATLVESLIQSWTLPEFQSGSGEVSVAKGISNARMGYVVVENIGTGGIRACMGGWRCYGSS